jgi:hypothetical protein
MKFERLTTFRRKIPKSRRVVFRFLRVDILMGREGDEGRETPWGRFFGTKVRRVEEDYFET